MAETPDLTPSMAMKRKMVILIDEGLSSLNGLGFYCGPDGEDLPVKFDADAVAMELYRLLGL